MEFVKDYKIENIKMWDKNPRNNELAVEKLIPLIEKYGFVNPVIIDQHGTLRAGHTRVKAMVELGYTEVPAIIYDFESEADAIGYALADNKISEVAEWEFTKLNDVLSELKSQNFDLEYTGFDSTILDTVSSADIDMEDFFETSSSDNNEEKNTTKVKCPHCGKYFEI